MHLWEKIDAKSVVSAEGCPGRKRNFIWMLKKPLLALQSTVKWL